MSASSYNTLKDVELLSIQANLTAAGDQRCLRLALDHLGQRSGSCIRVLDFGCGTGCVTASRFGNDLRFSVLAIDRDRFSIYYASKHHSSANITYKNIELQGIQPGEHFDILFASYVLHHNAAPQALLSLLWDRVASPGALIIRTCNDALLRKNTQTPFLSALEKQAEAAHGRSQRFHGQQLPHHILSLSPSPSSTQIVSTPIHSEVMTPDERMDFFDFICRRKLAYIQHAAISDLEKTSNANDLLNTYTEERKKFSKGAIGEWAHDLQAWVLIKSESERV